MLAPCGLGSVVTDETLPRLDCRIIAGGANNVLATPAHAAMLQARGILYAPDFCVNAGGLIFLEEQLLGHDSARAEARVRQVGVRVAEGSTAHGVRARPPWTPPPNSPGRDCVRDAPRGRARRPPMARSAAFRRAVPGSPAWPSPPR
ncbi:hypothetical protein [Streptomyces rapamycinicus]|uniref:hypothetical protein n=1 Tax=Streptomyces rapamycinicus TaxID=1226757 RepID=UPI0035A2D62E